MAHVGSGTKGGLGFHFCIKAGCVEKKYRMGSFLFRLGVAAIESTKREQKEK